MKKVGDEKLGKGFRSVEGGGEWLSHAEGRRGGREHWSPLRRGRKGKLVLDEGE